MTSSETKWSGDNLRSPPSITDEAISVSSNSSGVSALRSRLREQAKNAMERTRGAVQLSRRMSRSLSQQGLQSSSIGDQKGDDDHLEALIHRSIQDATRHTKHATGNNQDMGEWKKNFTDRFFDVIVDHTMTTDENLTPFESPQLIKPEMMSTSSEHLNKRTHAQGDIEISSKGTEKETMIRCQFKTEMAMEEEEDLVSLHGARDWRRQLTRANDKDTEMELEVGTLIFDYHWLFTEEELWASRLVSLNKEYEEVGEKRQSIEDVRMALRLSNEGEDEEGVVGEQLKSMLDQSDMVISRQRQLEEQLHKCWNQVEKAREAQGFASTRVSLLVDSSTVPSEGIIHPAFTLTTIDPSSLPSSKQDQPRIMAISRCKYSLSIYFNDQFVCRTPFRQLSRDFSVHFDQLYTLHVFQVPMSIVIVITERFDRGGGHTRTMASIGVPMPSSSSPILHQEIHFASDLLTDKWQGALGSGGDEEFISGRMSCTARWSRPGRLIMERGNETQMENERLPWSVQDDGRMIFSLIPDQLTVSPAPWLSLVNNKKKPNQRPIANETAIDVQRRAGQQYALMIRGEVSRQFTQSKRKILDEVVTEPINFQMMDGTGLGDVFKSLCSMSMGSRTLKPSRLPSSQRQSRGVHSHCSLLVRLISVSGLAQRLDGHDQKLYVLVTVQGKKCRTQNSSNGNWHETLQITDINVDQHDNSSLQIDIYEENIRPLPADERHIRAVHQEIQQIWLGSLSLPLSTILSSGRIDGSLPLQSPLLLDNQHRIITETKPMIKLFIAFEPAIQIQSEPIEWETSNGGESREMMDECREWRRNVSNQCRCLIWTSTGTRMILSRFLRSIRPPPFVFVQNDKTSKESEESINRALLVVSAIALLQDNVHLWITVDQILTMGCASAEEHALLLTCWLLALDVSVVMLMGTSLQMGTRGAFVAVMNEEMSRVVKLLDPVNGIAYSIDDTNCPLTHVFTLVSTTNVYANLQSQLPPAQIDFDLRKSDNWKPLLTRTTADLMVSCQPSNVTYRQREESELIELRTVIEREIKLRFDMARPSSVPQWNINASRVLRQVVIDLAEGSPEMDTVKTRLQSPEMDTVKTRLQSLSIAYRLSVNGFSRPYISVDETVNGVLRLCMHERSDEHCQFALAVHLRPLLDSAIICSVLVAALESTTHRSS